MYEYLLSNKKSVSEPSKSSPLERFLLKSRNFAEEKKEPEKSKESQAAATVERKKPVPERPTRASSPAEARKPKENKPAALPDSQSKSKDTGLTKPTIPYRESLVSRPNGGSARFSRKVSYSPVFSLTRIKLKSDEFDRIDFARKSAASACKKFNFAKSITAGNRYVVGPEDVQYLNDKLLYEYGRTANGQLPPGSVGQMPDGTVRTPEDFVNEYGRSHQGRYISDSWAPIVSQFTQSVGQSLGMDPAVTATIGSYAAGPIGDYLGVNLGGKVPGNVIASKNLEDFQREAYLRGQKDRDFELPKNPDELKYLNIKAKAQSASPYLNDIMSVAVPQFLGNIGASIQKTQNDLADYYQQRAARIKEKRPY